MRGRALFETLEILFLELTFRGTYLCEVLLGVIVKKMDGGGNPYTGFNVGAVEGGNRKAEIGSRIVVESKYILDEKSEVKV